MAIACSAAGGRGAAVRTVRDRTKSPRRPGRDRPFRRGHASRTRQRRTRHVRDRYTQRRLNMNRRTFLAVVGTTTALPAFAVQKKATIKLVSSLPRTGSATGMTNHIVNGTKL